ncbi:MAG: type 4a pilus biogenesis protein PilO [Elusimicrobiota bacterium]
MAIQLSKNQKQYVAAGVFMLAAFGFVHVKFFWLPVAAAKGEAREKIDQIVLKIAKAKQQAARLKNLQDEIARLNERAIEAEKRLPKSKSVPDILLTLSALAQRNRVQLQSFSPGAQKSQQYFIELAYPLAVKGGYHSIGRFLAALALEDRIFNIRDITYPAAGTDGEMTVTFTLLSYQYKG